MRTEESTPGALSRFLEAQEPVIDQAIAELRAGRKTSHWMWFVFPQLVGLGNSPTSEFYGIKDLLEAEAYLAHPVLGGRLMHCASAVLKHRGKKLDDILGYTDKLKFCSSMTLFSRVPTASATFHEALDTFCNGREDPTTLRLLAHADAKQKY